MFDQILYVKSDIFVHQSSTKTLSDSTVTLYEDKSFSCTPNAIILPVLQSQVEPKVNVELEADSTEAEAKIEDIPEDSK